MSNGFYKGKPEFKANLHIKADRNYVIQSGLKTLFAKGLVYTLSKLPIFEASGEQNKD